MCNYDGPMILTLFNDLKGSQSLTETHLGVPQHHLAAAVEFGNSLIDGQLLFRAEFNYLMNWNYLAGADPWGILPGCAVSQLLGAHPRPAGAKRRHRLLRRAAIRPERGGQRR